VCMSKASCGRSWLNSCRKWLNLRAAPGNCRRRARRLGLERAMHALVTPILLRFAGSMSSGSTPRRTPPRRELRQARQRVRGEGHAIVGANALRQPVFLEQACEHRLRPSDPRGQQPLQPRRNRLCRR